MTQDAKLNCHFSNLLGPDENQFGGGPHSFFHRLLGEEAGIETNPLSYRRLFFKL
jgi:hypothetical protein